MRARGSALLGVLVAFCVNSGAVQAEKGVPVQLSRDEIAAVQSKLRDLNYDLKSTAVLDDTTRSAIRQFLTNLGEPPADFLTSEQFARLKAIDTSSYLFAAVAASTDGKYAAVWNKKNHDQAESEAMSACAAKSSKASKCTVISRSDAGKEGWVAAVNCKRKEGHTIHTAVGQGGSRARERAIETAYKSAMELGNERSNCWLTTVVEAGGLHLLADSGKGSSSELPIAYANRGLKRLDKDETDDAMADFDQAIRLDPKLSKAYFGRGRTWGEKSNLDKAIADYDQAIRLGLNESLVYANRGWALYRKNDIDRAIADYDQAIRLDPKAATSYLNRGVAFDDKGELDRAISDYDQAIRINPSYALAFNDRGYTWGRKGELDRAIADYSRAIDLDPKYIRAYYNRANAYSRTGDYDRAIADYGQIIALDPSDGWAYLNRGNARQAKGASDEAIADFNEAIRRGPDKACLRCAYSSRGDVWSGKGDFDRAIADYSQAISIDPKSAYHYRDRGRANLYIGSLDKALADLSQAGALDPKNAYTALWLDIVSQRNNLPSRLPQASSQIDMTVWPAPIVKLFMGQLTAGAALAAADDPDATKTKGHVCEANFFTGELSLLKGEKDEAGRLFRFAANNCPHDFPEWVAANAELKALGVNP